MYRITAISCLMTAVCITPLTAVAQDTTKSMPGMPGMKMPAPKKSAPKTAPSTGKTEKPSAKARDTSEVRIPIAKAVSDSMTMRDTMSMPMRDTMTMRDTSAMSMPMRDTSQMMMHDTTHMRMADSTHMMHGDTMPMMMMEGPLGISMDRLGSGSTWIPDAVSLPARHFMLGGWSMMLHGFAFAQYDAQGGPRGGDSQFGSLNWAMLMADRELARGRFTVRFMPSIDAATVGKCGYPLLLQSGETCNGAPLFDRQHPHDFFMELAAQYDREISKSAAMFIYAGPSGEPALGPVAFMHRPSAMDNPAAPLGHHWQDATHISFGVVTAGIYSRTARIEASAFNGLEPDENRWDIDPIKLNSYSARLTLNPTQHWSFTTGYGRIAEPEPGDADHKFNRVVVSAMHGTKLSDDAQWTTTFLIGANQVDSWSGSGLLESEAVLNRHHTLFGRAEIVRKSAGELAVTTQPAGAQFNVGAATVGYIYDFARGRGSTLGLGAMGTVNVVPLAFERAYGDRTPVGAMIFLRWRPVHSRHASMSSMPGMSMHGSEETHQGIADTKP